MATITLTYFDAPVSRGEECRLALHLAGLAFHDERLERATWSDRKPRTPFGSLPVLTVEGRGQLAQSNAILQYVGREHGLLPKDAWESARHEAVLNAVEDLRKLVDPTGRIADPEEKRKAREALATGGIPAWAGFVERQIGEGPFFGGADPSVADVKLYVVLKAYVTGRIDHVPPTVFDPFPKLTRLYRAMDDLPTIRSWYAR